MLGRKADLPVVVNTQVGVNEVSDKLRDREPVAAHSG